ncbi:MAG: EAL domain-containing protein [Deinococcus-Thermus bacterium]|jgi:diguanylate cyclase (GGDEF)-like protein/PAS domain S-box-containing protein|nr:EAL domain-containing protein [Deinococcota bacterium]
MTDDRGREDRSDPDVLRLVRSLFGAECYTVSDLRDVGQPIVYASEAFASFSGYDVDEVLGRSLAFLQRDDGDQDGLRDMREAVAEGRPCTVVLRNYRRDGSLFFNEQRHYPLRDEAGRVSHLVSVQRDVSERMHALGVVDAGDRIGRRGQGGFFGYSVLLRPDREPQLLWVGDACVNLTGFAAGQLLEAGAGAWVHPDDRDDFHEAQILRRSERSHRLRYRLVARDGRVRWVEDHGQRSWTNHEAHAVAVHALVRDVSSERRARTELWHVENVDALTGLPNERRFRDRLEQAVVQARRDGTGTVLALLDLDAFSFVNETIGRVQGDRLLQEVANRLRRAARAGDGLARLEGDRFALALADVRSPEAAVPLVRQVRERLAEPVRWHGGEMRLSISGGLARVGGDAEGGEAAEPRDPAEAVDRWLDGAERALERAKLERRGDARFEREDDDARLRARAEVEEELRGALAHDQLVLHYQPRIDLRTGKLAGVEALVRWLHPRDGLLKPDAFLPSLTRAGLDPELFRWVLPRALGQAAAWREAGRPCRVAVNVGRPTLEHADFSAWVREELERFDLNPSLLELELTEGTPTEVFDRHLPALAELRARGVRVSLDDFGVANASLAQLQRLPLDGLKIDKRFVDRLTLGSRGDREMIRAIVAIGKSLGLTVVAEGVETPEQRETLERLHCDEVQGYLYGQAVPADYALQVPIPAD